VGKEVNALTKVLEYIWEEKGFIYTTFGNISSTLLGALFWFILASILQVRDYGEVNYLIALAVIPASIASLGLNTVVVTYLAKGEEKIVWEADTIALFSGVIAGLILFGTLWIASLIVAALVFFNMSIAEILGRKYYKEYALATILQRAIQIISSIILYLEIGILGILIGYFLGPMLMSYRFLGNLKNLTFRIDGLRNKINFMLHSYGQNLVGSFSTYLDKIIIGGLFGLYSLGLYQLGFQFLMLLAAIPGSLYNYLLPEESSGVNRARIKIIGIISSLVLALMAIFIAPYIVNLLFPNFIESIRLIQIMSLAIIPLTITSLANARLFGEERSKYVFLGGVIYVLTMVAGLVVLGLYLGDIGLAIAILFAQSSRALYLSSKVGIL